MERSKDWIEETEGDVEHARSDMERRSPSTVRIFYPKLSKEKVILRIQKALVALQGKLPLKLVVLFGSHAKGNYTVASDIDLLIVYEGVDRMIKDGVVLSPFSRRG